MRESEIGETSGPHASAALRLSAAEKLEEQTYQVAHVLRSVIRAKRSLFGQTICGPTSLFNIIDTDRSGELSADEMSAGLTRLGLGITDDQLRYLQSIRLLSAVALTNLTGMPY